MRVGVSGQSRAAGPVPGDSSGHVQTVQIAQLRMQLRMPHRRTSSADPRVPLPAWRGAGVRSLRFVHRPDLGARTLSAWRQFNGYSHEQHRSRRVCSLFASVPAGHPGAPCSLVARACPPVCAVWPGPWARGSAEQDPPAGPAQPPRLPGERETGGDRSFAAGRPRPRRSGGVRAVALSSAASYVRSMWQHYS